MSVCPDEASNIERKGGSKKGKKGKKTFLPFLPFLPFLLPFWRRSTRVAESHSQIKKMGNNKPSRSGYLHSFRQINFDSDVSLQRPLIDRLRDGGVLRR